MGQYGLNGQHRPSLTRTVALLALAFGSTGCIELTYSRVRAGRPLEPVAVDWALASRPSLTEALDALGAPDRVRHVESQLDVPEGTELLWVWRYRSGYSLTGSLPVEQGGSASFQVADDRVRLDGLRLSFDLDGRFVRGSVGAVGTQEPDLGLPFVP